MGHEFLKHIERTELLIHVLDISGIEGRDPLEDYKLINSELANYNKNLENKKQIIYANKMDLPGAEENLERLKEELKDADVKIFSGSVVKQENLQDLLYYVWDELGKIERKYETYDEEHVEIVEQPEEILIEQIDNNFIVSGDEIENLISSINFDDDESIKFFQNMLIRKGVIELLDEAGIEEGDNVFIGDIEFEYIK